MRKHCLLPWIADFSSTLGQHLTALYNTSFHHPLFLVVTFSLSLLCPPHIVSLSVSFPMASVPLVVSTVTMLPEETTINVLILTFCSSRARRIVPRRGYGVRPRVTGCRTIHRVTLLTIGNIWHRITAGVGCAKTAVQIMTDRRQFCADV